MLHKWNNVTIQILASFPCSFGWEECGNEGRMRLASLVPSPVQITRYLYWEQDYNPQIIGSIICWLYATSGALNTFGDEIRFSSTKSLSHMIVTCTTENRLCSLQAQYVFIHKAMMEVMESMSTLTKSSNFTPGYSSPGIYANRKQQFLWYITITRTHKNCISLLLQSLQMTWLKWLITMATVWVRKLTCNSSIS